MKHALRLALAFSVFVSLEITAQDEAATVIQLAVKTIGGPLDSIDYSGSGSSAYLPNEKLLIQADAYHPRPGAEPLASPSPYTVNLLENIRRLKLDVAQIVHVHGGVDSFASLVKAAGN